MGQTACKSPLKIVLFSFNLFPWIIWILGTWLPGFNEVFSFLCNLKSNLIWNGLHLSVRKPFGIPFKSLVCLKMGLCLYPECTNPERHNPDNVVVPSVTIPNDRQVAHTPEGCILVPDQGDLVKSRSGEQLFGKSTYRDWCGSGLVLSG